MSKTLFFFCCFVSRNGKQSDTDIDAWTLARFKYAENRLSCRALVDFEPVIELGHDSIMSYANNEGADQPAHARSLISTFVVRCLDSIVSLDCIAEISRL